MTADNSRLTAGSDARRDIFPEPKEIFTFEPKRFTVQDAEYVVVLDTSTLLLPYEVNTQSLVETKRVLQLCSSERLFVPAHAVREFARRRPEKIAELVDALTKKISSIDNSKPAIGRIAIVQGSKVFDAMQTSEAAIAIAIRDWKQSADALLEELRSFGWRDPVSDMYRDIGIANVLISHNLTQSEIDADQKKRSTATRPPGYMDAGKNANSEGDLEIWHSILQAGREFKKSLVFVTSDVKRDWWHKAGKDALFVRVELVDEYRIASGGKSFSAIQFHDLLAAFGADTLVLENVKAQESLSGAISVTSHSSGTLGTSDMIELNGVATSGELAISGSNKVSLTAYGDSFALESSGIESGISPVGGGPFRSGKEVSVDAHFAGSFLGRGPVTIDGKSFGSLSFGGQIDLKAPVVQMPSDPSVKSISVDFICEVRLAGYLQSAFIPSPMTPSVRLSFVASGKATCSLRRVDIPGNAICFDVSSVKYEFSRNASA